MLAKKNIGKTISNLKIMFNRQNKKEKLSLVYSNINLNGLPKGEFSTEDVPTYIHSNGFVYKMTSKGGRFL